MFRATCDRSLPADRHILRSAFDLRATAANAEVFHPAQTCRSRPLPDHRPIVSPSLNARMRKSSCFSSCIQPSPGGTFGGERSLQRSNSGRGLARHRFFGWLVRSVHRCCSRQGSSLRPWRSYAQFAVKVSTCRQARGRYMPSRPKVWISSAAPGPGGGVAGRRVHNGRRCNLGVTYIERSRCALAAK